MIWVGVILAGGVGAVLRFLLDGAVARRAAKSLPFAGLPFGTLAVNISGAAVLGFLGALTLDRYAALLAALDDRELKLERLKHLSEIQNSFGTGTHGVESRR